MDKWLWAGPYTENSIPEIRAFGEGKQRKIGIERWRHRQILIHDAAANPSHGSWRIEQNLKNRTWPVPDITSTYPVNRK